MLSEILEEAVMKCTQYWPDVGCTDQFGAVQVTCASEQHFAHHSLRTFHILLNGKKVRGAMQTVQQYQVSLLLRMRFAAIFVENRQIAVP